MIDATRQIVEKQVRHVRRRLFMQVLLQSLLFGWALGLLMAAIWFLLRPFTFTGLGEAARWGVPGALLAAGTVGGGVLAWKRRPNLVMSSLALDEKFGLKERVTTLLTLPPELLRSPAGHALLQDVKACLGDVRLAGKFPLRISTQQLLMAGGALCLALLACVFDPILGDLKFGSRTIAEQPRKLLDNKEIQKQMDELRKLVTKRNEDLPAKSEELKELEKEFEKLINQPLDARSEEKIRERITEMRKLEDKMKERLEGLKEKTEKIDFLKRQMEKLGMDKNAKLKDGPAKDFEDALMKGQFDKAKDILESLVKELKNDKLSKEQQKDLADQLAQLNEKMKKLLDNDLIKQLKEDAKKGTISQEELERAMENFKDVKELSDVLGECSECLGKLDGKEAAAKLEELVESFRQTELTEEEIRDLLRDQDEIDEAARILMAAMQGGEGDGERSGGRRQADPNDPNSKILDQRQKALADPRAAQRVTGYARGGTFNKIPAKAVEGAFRQAVQEAPDALERQRIPDDAADIARGYFNKLGNQK